MLPKDKLPVCSMTKIFIVPSVLENQHIFPIPHSNVQYIGVQNNLWKQCFCCDAISPGSCAALIFFLCWHGNTMRTLTPLWHIFIIRRGVWCPSPAGISPLTMSPKAAGCLRSSSKANVLNCSMLKPSTRFYNIG